MRVTDNMVAFNLLHQINSQRSQQADLQKKLSTQQRIHKASDDPISFKQVKEIYSKERSMHSYRSNLGMGKLVSELSNTSLDFLKQISTKAIDTSNLLQTQINDRTVMKDNANLINELIEQAIDQLNAQNGDEYLFSGSTLTVKPYETLVDSSTGRLSGTGQQKIGTTQTIAATEFFALTVGSTYQIKDNTGFDFTTVGAAANTVGTTFTYNGNTITPATAAASVLQVDAYDLKNDVLYQVEGSTGADVQKATTGQKFELTPGATYQITDNAGLTAAQWQQLDSAGVASAVGDRFIYNGTNIPAVTNSAAVTQKVEDQIAAGGSFTVANLVDGASYTILETSGLDYTALGAASNAIGTTFEYNGVASAVATGTEKLALSDARLDPGTSQLAAGATYKIVTTAGFDYTTIGAAANTVGSTFVYNGAAFVAPAAGTEELSTAASGFDYVSHFGANSNAVGTTFVYDKTKTIPTPTSGPTVVTQVSDNIGANQKHLLVEGKAYEIYDPSSVAAATDFTNSGSVNSKHGTQFVYNGNDPTFGAGVELIPLDLVETKITSAADLSTDKLYKVVAATPLGTELPNIVEGDTLEAGKIYRIEKTGGGIVDLTGIATDQDNVGATDTPLNVEGAIFISNGTNPPVFDGVEFKEMTIEANTTIGDDVISGETYLVQQLDTTSASSATNRDLSLFGGAAAATVGNIFTATVGGKLPDGAVVQKVVTSAEAGKTYQLIAGAGSNLVAAGIIDNVTPGANGANYSNTLATAELGQIFTADTAGAVPAGAALIELVNAEQTSVDEGESFVIAGSSAQVAPAAKAAVGYRSATAPTTGEIANDGIITANEYLNNPDILETGTTYTIRDNGSDLDLSNAAFNITSPGASGQPGEVNVGNKFTVTAAVPGTFDFAGSQIIVVTAGATSTVGAGGTVTQISDFDTTGATTYEVIDNGSNIDFAASGASNNNFGTSFIYNGTKPSFSEAYAELEHTIPATNFVQSGASDNNAGTVFTANATEAEFGVSGKLYKFKAARTTSSDFTDSGSASNDIGTKFVYNGVSPEFGDSVNGQGGGLFEYKREALAVAYVGSDSNFGITSPDAGEKAGFYMAEDMKINPYTDIEFTERFQDFMNGLVKLRDAYQKAADAQDTNDTIARDTALEKAKEAVNLIDSSDQEILSAMANHGGVQLNMEIAENKDNQLFKAREDMVSRRIDINEAEVVAGLNQSLNAFQSTLAAGARTMSLSLLDYI